MEDAGQPIALVPAEGERDAAMGAGLVEEADLAIVAAKGHVLLAKQLYALRRPTRREGLAAQGWNPVPLPIPMKRCTGGYVSQQAVLFGGEHG
ncbi:hypothetical protein D3C84_821180 [compost metagenome]